MRESLLLLFHLIQLMMPALYWVDAESG